MPTPRGSSGWLMRSGARAPGMTPAEGSGVSRVRAHAATEGDTRMMVVLAALQLALAQNMVDTAAPSGVDRFGHTVLNVGDLDMDGVDDLQVGAPRPTVVAFQPPGTVLWYSGATGVPIAVRTGVSPSDNF